MVMPLSSNFDNRYFFNQNPISNPEELQKLLVIMGVVHYMRLVLNHSRHQGKTDMQQFRLYQDTAVSSIRSFNVNGPAALVAEVVDRAAQDLRSCTDYILEVLN